MTRPARLLGALTLVLHPLILFVGFEILGHSFDFPEILRESASVRLARFEANASVVVPTYWALTFSGFTQILCALFLARALPRTPLATRSSVVLGTLAGAFQAVGFGRWVIAVPYLAEQAHTTDVALVEGTLNRFAGMLVGEHLANLAWGGWLL
ncbi:MAG: DUF4386 family protein, partial [Planctomycetes bacterium]|nr:DUF4386 family protein [Planctomycetota bacterium]